ncbi:MAG: TetR/AcrR family transcriptional regulator [Anaerolineaceae bacterium]|nr:TetR/AcrR family transcriptional regulator [Anaerolineaceae bacterium]
MSEVVEKMDRRKQRTRQYLRDALMALIVEKGYEAISIQDITDRANVSRPTFYLHYRDKEELLLTSLEEVYDDLNARVGEITPGGMMADGNPVELVAFQHVAEFADFYRVMLSSRGVAAFIIRVQHYLASVFQQHVQICFPAGLTSTVPIDILAYREAGALIGTLSWWLENEMPYPPTEMAHLHYQSGAKGVLWGLGITLDAD